MFSQIIFVTFFLVCQSSCIFQQLTLYSDEDGNGEALAFRSKLVNLTRYQDFIVQAKSYCQIGWWEGYTLPNFAGNVSYQSEYYNEVTCFNGTFGRDVQSLRFQGPLDTGYESIAVYEGNSDDAWSGAEIIVTHGSASCIGFSPKGLLISGGSEWTTYPNDDFTGTPTCYVGTNDLSKFVVLDKSVASMERGCTHRTRIMRV